MHASATAFSLTRHNIVEICTLGAIRTAGQGYQAKKLNTWLALNLSLYWSRCYNSRHTTK